MKLGLCKGQGVVDSDICMTYIVIVKVSNGLGCFFCCSKR